MQSLGFSRYAVALFATAVVLAGCGGSQGNLNGLGPTQDRVALDAGKHRGTGSYGDLLYVSGGPTDKVYVFSYPDGVLVQTLTGLDFPGAECSDAAGNVWIEDNTGLFEYAHGGTSPIRTLHGATGGGCAVDSATGNLAATNQDSVLIWPSGSDTPTTYTYPGLRLEYCGYDASGNLFIDLHGVGDFLLELPYGGNALEKLTLSKRIGQAGQVQWDGSNMTVQDESKPFAISRLQISGSSATVIGATKPKGIKKHAALSWIAENAIVIPFGNRRGGAKKIGLWSYPGGGRPTKVLDNFGFSRKFAAAVVSVAP